MSRSIDRQLYSSRRWKRCRDAYMSSQNYICERCGNLASICHHKIYLNSENVNDPMIVFNHDLLECLCRDCHNKEHFKTESTRNDLKFDENGNLVRK